MDWVRRANTPCAVRQPRALALQFRYAFVTDADGLKVIDVTDTTSTIEITGNSEKIDAFVESLSSITIHEMVRSGLIGISRGEKALI